MLLQSDWQMLKIKKLSEYFDRKIVDSFKSNTKKINKNRSISIFSLTLHNIEITIQFRCQSYF